MRHSFINTQNLTIGANTPNTVRSELVVNGVNGAIQGMAVRLTLFHSYTSDLRITLISPAGQRVLLVSNAGADGDHFLETLFDDTSPSLIFNAQAPFRGAFHPQEPLSAFNGSDANGRWQLEIEDQWSQDGGSLQNWELLIDAATATVQSDFQIDVRFQGGLNSNQQQAFATAAQRWSEIIVGDLPAINTDVGLVDDVIIDARGTFIDGPNRTLGRAGPTLVRPDSLLPCRGIMEFDTADLDQMEQLGTLVNVIIHEMAHVLGVGTIWQQKRLLAGAGSSNPVFVGSNAMREFGHLSGTGPQPVPVANTGGAGTRDGHWRESVFGQELLTGWLNQGRNPISRMSIAALEDMGYQVNYEAADPYLLSDAFAMSVMGVGAAVPRELCGNHAPGIVVAEP